MAYSVGLLTVTIEAAKDLKERYWNCRQDPYCTVTVGPQTFRTRAAVEAGRNPSWGETFQFNVARSDTTLVVEVKDGSPDGQDATLGSATCHLAEVQASGSEHLTAPVRSHKSQKQHGIISASLTWVPYIAGKTLDAATAQPNYFPAVAMTSPMDAPAAAPAAPVAEPIPYGVPAPYAAVMQPYPYQQPLPYQAHPSYPPYPPYQQSTPSDARQERASSREQRQRRKSGGIVHSLLTPVRAVVWRASDTVHSVHDGLADSVRGVTDGLTATILGPEGRRRAN